MLKWLSLRKICRHSLMKTTPSRLPVVVVLFLPLPLSEKLETYKIQVSGITGQSMPVALEERSSGKKVRHVKTRSGNRRLNCAFHRMALSQISRMGNDKARAYFKRKISEGKSKSQALVCLRRQMVNIVWMMLKHKTVYRNA